MESKGTLQRGVPKIGRTAARDWNNAVRRQRWLNRPNKSAEDIAAIEAAEAKRERKRQKLLARG